MAMAKASVTGASVPPRKARLVADMIRGKKVAEAREILIYTPRASSPMIRKVLESAVANAENTAAEARERVDTDAMVVTDIQVNQGRTLKRFMPAARGLGMRRDNGHLLAHERVEHRALAHVGPPDEGPEARAVLATAGLRLA